MFIFSISYGSFTWPILSVYRFNNPDDLSDYNTISIGVGAPTFIGKAYDIIYVSQTDKLYVLINNTDTGFGQVYEIDPITLIATQIVDIDTQYFELQSICSDGSFIYIVNADDGKILKIDLSDNSYTIVTVAGLNYCHSIRYDGTHLYATAINANKLYKIDPATMTILLTLSTGIAGPTDDFAFAGDLVKTLRDAVDLN